MVSVKIEIIYLKIYSTQKMLLHRLCLVPTYQSCVTLVRHWQHSCTEVWER